MSTLYESILKQYKENTAPKKPSNTYDLKNYFAPRLEKNEQSTEKTIRIVPTPDGSSPLQEIYAHKVQLDGEYKTFVCAKMKNEPCPFCDAKDAIYANVDGKLTDESKKELLKKYGSRKMYVVKVIDRDNEKDGVKFWRFPHDYRKQGIFDKIYTVLSVVKKDIFNAKDGHDLVISVARDQNNNPVVQAINAVFTPSPLSTDEAISESWINDTRTWENVYSVKPYNYLEIIVKGGVPEYNKELKCYFDKNSVSKSETIMAKEETLKIGGVKSNIQAAVKVPAPVVDVDVDIEPIDDDVDMPF